MVVVVVVCGASELPNWCLNQRVCFHGVCLNFLTDCMNQRVCFSAGRSGRGGSEWFPKNNQFVFQGSFQTRCLRLSDFFLVVFLKYI